MLPAAICGWLAMSPDCPADAVDPERTSLRRRLTPGCRRALLRKRGVRDHVPRREVRPLRACNSPPAPEPSPGRDWCARDPATGCLDLCVELLEGSPFDGLAHAIRVSGWRRFDHVGDGEPVKVRHRAEPSPAVLRARDQRRAYGRRSCSCPPAIPPLTRAVLDSRHAVACRRQRALNGHARRLSPSSVSCDATFLGDSRSTGSFACSARGRPRNYCCSRVASPQRG